ncbi:MAG: zinc metallopeptidase [Planctomycetes bacterium]|nr:zinc metallopeptidase [Planctomycetota bacterium]
MMYFDFTYILYIAPAMLLAFWAQRRVKTTFAQAQQVSVPLSGAAAARHILDAAGLQNVGIEQIPGQLSDHYDPRDKVLRLSQDVYGARTTAAVGIAAHEAGHALQDAHNYVPLVIRNAAVPVASFGGNISSLLVMGGLGLLYAQIAIGETMLLVGIAAFACVVAFQLVNLPVEFDASARAKRLLTEHGIVADQDMVYVNRVLNAAAWTYVAATLQAVLTLLYYIMRYAGSRD